MLARDDFDQLFRLLPSRTHRALHAATNGAFEVALIAVNETAVSVSEGISRIERDRLGDTREAVETRRKVATLLRQTRMLIQEIE